MRGNVFGEVPFFCGHTYSPIVKIKKAFVFYYLSIWYIWKYEPSEDSLDEILSEASVCGRFPAGVCLKHGTTSAQHTALLSHSASAAVTCTQK